MSSTLGFPSKFGRANEVVIDKAIGSKPQWTRRFSLRRSLRSFTGIKARRHALQTLISPITPKSWTSTVHGIVMLAVYHLQLIYLPFSPSYYQDGSLGTTVIMILFEGVFLLDLLLNFNTAYVEQEFSSRLGGKSQRITSTSGSSSTYSQLCHSKRHSASPLVQFTRHTPLVKERKPRSWCSGFSALLCWKRAYY